MAALNPLQCCTPAVQRTRVGVDRLRLRVACGGRHPWHTPEPLPPSGSAVCHSAGPGYASPLLAWITVACVLARIPRWRPARGLGPPDPPLPFLAARLMGFAAAPHGQSACFLLLALKRCHPPLHSELLPAFPARGAHHAVVVPCCRGPRPTGAQWPLPHRGGPSSLSVRRRHCQAHHWTHQRSVSRSSVLRQGGHTRAARSSLTDPRFGSWLCPYHRQLQA